MTAAAQNPAAQLKAVPSQQTEKVTLIQAITRALADEMRRDPSVLILGEDVGVDGGVFRATEGLLEEFGPDRVMDTPLAESGIIGTSIGLAVAGFRPVPEIQFMGFIYPALNQIFAHAARMRTRSRGRFTVPMVIRMPYGGGIRPPEHHSESYESLLIHTPGLKVVVPSNPHDAKGLLISAIRDNDPVIFMEPKRIYRAFREEIPVEPFTVPLGKAHVLREGTDVTLVAYGAMVRVCLEAAQWLEKDGISSEIIDLRTLHPLDRDTVLNSVARTGRAVVVHEAPKTLGLGAEITALINEHLLLQLLAPVERVAGFDSVFPLAQLEDHYLPHKDRVIAAVRKTLEF
ncbi:MAG TPA: alpha-ketoacid dehydrogenase subunit beta [Thermoanaerobaculia bacterium]|nr:alpha-ketoacid dehydrogenase subunit beta [Thermoanaerobaculia bacterium]HUM30007.1 alpha-ketoacid dehydrogenase subunit beta [Thermoanaerobaculia bacterium]HXK68304.1 alpha-ketoacid dehydrogenase subunit beta [Thermoanaerobaculia bacterium]